VTARTVLPTGLELPTNYLICLGRCGLEFQQPQRIPFCRRCLDKMTPAIRDNIAELGKQVHRREPWIESWRLHSIRQCLRHLRLIPAIYGLTLKNPWAWAVAHAGKRIENRTGPLGCKPRDFLALHAGKSTDPDGARWMRERLGIAADPNPRYSAIIAVCRYGGAVQNCKDPWAFPGHVHHLFDDVVTIDPISASGAQGLWLLRPELLELVLGN